MMVNKISEHVWVLGWFSSPKIVLTTWVLHFVLLHVVEYFMN